MGKHRQSKFLGYLKLSVVWNAVGYYMSHTVKFIWRHAFGLGLALVMGLVLFANVPSTMAESVDKMPPTDQAKSWVYANMLKQCIARGGDNYADGANGDRIYAIRNAANFRFWDGGVRVTAADLIPFLGGGVQPEIILGNYNLSVNGEINCGSAYENDAAVPTEWLKGALELWGFDDPVQFLCDIDTPIIVNALGQEEEENSDCVKIALNKYEERQFGPLNWSKAEEHIRSNVYNNQNIGMTPAAKYIYYRETFFNGCQIDSRDGYDGKDRSSHYFEGVKIYDEEESIAEPMNFYSAIKKTDSRIESAYDGGQITCEEIINKINQNAGAYAVWRKNNANTDAGKAEAGADQENRVDANEGEDEDEVISCAISGVGFIVCPAIDFLAGVADQTYAFLASNFLKIDPGLTGDSVYQAWGVARNLANAGFVLIFLIVIYSQITGMGISNYGIKKILQKLFVSAVLVNLSFFICQLAVDLSNILGYAVKDLFDGIANTPGIQENFALPKGDWTATSAKDGLGLTFAWGALAVVGGVTLYAALPFLGGAILAALIAGLTIGFLLIIRKALIVMLIVMAPLAFLAMTLPNTEGMYKKWQKMFMSMLVVFPVVGLLFGAGHLTSAVLTPVGKTNEDIVLQIVASISAILPLFLVWPVMKKSMEAAGAITGAIQGISGKMGGAAQNRYKESTLGQMSDYSKQMRAQKRRKIQAGVYKGKWYNPLTYGNIAASKAHGVFSRRLSGQFGKRTAAAGQAMVDKEEAEAAERAITYQYNGDLGKALESKNTAVQALAAKQLAGKGEYGAGIVADYLQKSDSKGVTSQSMADALASMKGTHAGIAEVGAGALKHFQSGKSDNFRVDQAGFASMTREGLKKMGEEALSRQSGDALRLADSSTIDSNTANNILTDRRLLAGMNPNSMAEMRRLARGGPPNQVGGGNPQGGQSGGRNNPNKKSFPSQQPSQQPPQQPPQNPPQQPPQQPPQNPPQQP